MRKFLKYSDGKPKYSLIPPKPIEGLARVLTYGAQKYKPNNWKKCKDTSVYVDALMRHLEAHRSGILFDGESGLPHLHHALCNLVFLCELEVEGKLQIKE